MRIVTFERRARPRSAQRGPGSPGPGSLGATPAGAGGLEESRGGARRLGALVAEGREAGAVVDLNRALAVELALGDAGAPEAEADALLPPDALDFLRRGPGALAAARRALEFALRSLGRYDAPDLRAAGIVLPRDGVRLCAPVPRPGKILGVARNYPAHARERGDAGAPEEPVLFVKASSAVIGPDDEVVLPAATQRVDYEGELAVIVGRTARRVAREEALACVAGYCVANDVTARDFQNVRGQHFLGKSCDTFAPLGPALVTADEVADPQDLGLRTRLCGREVQSARTKEMHFGVAELVAFASRLLTLEPGDVILTGTPAGVGAAADPPRWLRDGDVVEVEIERLGRIASYVRSEAASDVSGMGS